MQCDKNIVTNWNNITILEVHVTLIKNLYSITLFNYKILIDLSHHGNIYIYNN